MNIDDIIRQLEEMKQAQPRPVVTFAYRKRRMLRWQPLAMTGMDPDEAKRQATAQGLYYDADWLMYSLDNGRSWEPVPPGKDIPHL